MNDELFDDFKKEFEQLVNDQQKINLEMTPLEAWSIMAMVQLGCRHPNTKESPTRNIAEHWALNIQHLIAQTPALKKVAQMGWHPEHDV